MQEHEPTAAELATAGVEAVWAINLANSEYTEFMAHDFLRAAWPSLRAQNQ